MCVPLVRSGSSVPRWVIAATGAAAAGLLGCAMEPVPDGARARPACRINSVLYCDVAVRPGAREQKCGCLPAREIRDVLRGFSRP